MTKKVFSKRSEENLKGINSTLDKIVRRALELSEVDFTVVEGLRTIERQKELYAQGATKTLNSYHIVGKAVDLYPYYDGSVQVNAPRDQFEKIARAMGTAAGEHGARVGWGGDWISFMDMPHFQLEFVQQNENAPS